MVLEMSVSDVRAKRRVLVLLHELGWSAESGSVRTAHPFSIVVNDVPDADLATLRRVIATADPGATTIGITRPVAAVAA
ncbi:MAG: hypothetical protein F2667_00545 [Actinobacteria bacterium]|uniref:Unannotated protein n=1 Tax=freshwater metagenome TaxID=449393 RepID=A0A6J6NGU1_9ZZZZ|nr:hypothetical protein [Actinomycetota bacterium]